MHSQFYERVYTYVHVRMYIFHHHYVCTYSSSNLQECVDLAFEKADDYASRFEPFREFYQSNEDLDLTQLKEDQHGRLLACMYSNSVWQDSS